MADTQPTAVSQTEESLPISIHTDRERLLTVLLRGVSRTFSLTLRVLPRSLRGPVGLAYLLARTADTIADKRKTNAPTDYQLAVVQLQFHAYEPK